MLQRFSSPPKLLKQDWMASSWMNSRSKSSLTVIAGWPQGGPVIGYEVQVEVGTFNLKISLTGGLIGRGA
jgi:hypothetical protein